MQVITEKIVSWSLLFEHLTFLSVNQHKNEFEKLIADMQKRKKGQRNKSAKKTPG